MIKKLKTNITPPITKKVRKTIKQLDKTRYDNYSWLKDDNWQIVMTDTSKLSPEINEHLHKENLYTEQVLEDLEPLCEKILEEMKGRLEPNTSTVPSPDHNYAYNHKYKDNDEHGVYQRFPIDQATREISEEPQVILDAEKLSKLYPSYFDIGDVAHSKNHEWLAYSVDGSGAENYEIFIKPMHGQAHTTKIVKSNGEIQWAKDNSVLFWVERDDNQRPSAVYAKNIHDKFDAPKLIYLEKDPSFFVSVGETDSGNYIEINIHNHTTNEVWIIPADKPYDKPICVNKRTAGHEYSIHDHNENLYILTNYDNSTDFAVMHTSVNDLDSKHWNIVIPHRPGTLILGLRTFSNYLVRLVRENALPKIIIRNLNDNSEKVINFDEEAYSISLLTGHEYNTRCLRFSYSSPTTPKQIYDYDMYTHKRVLLQTQNVPSGHTATDYTCERIYIKSRDGSDIPVTLLYHSRFIQDGKSPLLLYGYGSYGITIPASFRTSILPLVDRGITYAIAHIRGGMSKGYQWYLDGKLQKKENTFNDYIDVGIGLCKKKYTSPGMICAYGGSAGGLLVGAAINQAPKLFAGAVAAVPFVDVLNTMSDSQLPLTPPEWPEWGNPLINSDDYDCISAYSPYENVTKNDYPPILITGGLTDPRVTYWEPAKWAAVLRENQKGNAPILLKINMDSGHQGQPGRYDSLKEVSLEYAFIISIL